VSSSQDLNWVHYLIFKISHAASTAFHILAPGLWCFTGQISAKKAKIFQRIETTQLI
jgi:hypothetical protein